MRLLKNIYVERDFRSSKASDSASTNETGWFTMRTIKDRKGMLAIS